MTKRATALEPYLEVLRELPFVQAVTVTGRSRRQAGTAVVIRTRKRSYRLHVEIKTSHLSYGAADEVIHTRESTRTDWLLAAPHIGKPMARYLRERQINYVDRQGNCSLNLGNQHIALIEGRSAPPRPAAFKGLRAAGYQVLFTYLAQPDLAAAPIREVARAAGVSRQAVQDMRNRLVHEGVLVKAGRSHRWVAPRRRDALDRWHNGYRDVVRPALLIGRYRTPDTDPAALEKRIARVFGEGPSWRFGGCAAGHRLTGTYRGEETVVHVDAVQTEDLRRLKALPDTNGPLILLRPPGPIALDGRSPDTVHPLLVYSEMLLGNERAREAALDVFDGFLDGP